MRTVHSLAGKSLERTAEVRESKSGGSFIILNDQIAACEASEMPVGALLGTGILKPPHHPLPFTPAVSSLGLVWMFSSFVSGPLMEHLGLRRLLLLSLLPSALCWLLLAFPLATWVVYVGRVGTCATAGIINTILQPLLAELCQPRYRGFALTLPEIMVSVGLLFTYALPRFLSWQASAALLAAPFLPMFLLMLLVPEVGSAPPPGICDSTCSLFFLSAARRLIKKRNSEHPFSHFICTTYMLSYIFTIMLISLAPLLTVAVLAAEAGQERRGREGSSTPRPFL